MVLKWNENCKSINICKNEVLHFQKISKKISAYAYKLGG